MTPPTQNEIPIDPKFIFSEPPDFLQFVATENLQFLTSLATCREEIDFLTHIHGLYLAAMKDKTISQDRVIIVQLLTLVHYHFLFSCSCYMRCHLSEAFNSARVAIDASLIAAHIIQNPASQKDYAERKAPFTMMVRHYKNFIKGDKSKLPHPLIETLVDLHTLCSTFASHADINAFQHRVDYVGDDDKKMSFGYFQFARNPQEMKYFFLALLKTFVMTLDIFADFLVKEVKFLPDAWQTELHVVGMRIQTRQNEIRPPAQEAAASA